MIDLMMRVREWLSQWFLPDDAGEMVGILMELTLLAAILIPGWIWYKVRYDHEPRVVTSDPHYGPMA